MTAVHVIVAIIGLLAMLAGFASSNMISIGVSAAIFGAALWIGAAVHMAGAAVVRELRKP